MIEVQFKKIHKSAFLPFYAHEGDSGLDLRAIEDLLIPKGEYRLINTGLGMQLPQGTEAQVRPRSGLALEHGITTLNSPGTIDSGYRGEIGVLLINHGKLDYLVKRGDKVAQLVIASFVRASIKEVDILEPSQRGSKGYGSSGY